MSFILTLALVAMPPHAAGQASSFVEKPNGEICGTVLSDANNQPATQVTVSLRSHALGIFRSVLTDFAGHFEVRSLPPGSYDIKVEEQGFEPMNASAQVEASPVNLVLRLKPSAVSATGQKSYTVSVRDMKISGKARDEYNKGLESLEKRDWQASLGHFTKAVKAFPEYYEAYYHMGLVEANLGQLDDAFGAFQKSLDVSRGRYARADFGVGYVLYLRGQLNEAEGVLRRGLEVDDHGPEGHVMLGMALLRLNRADEAEKCAQEALLRNPNFAQAYLVLADALARRHRFQEQLQSLETYLRLEPNGPLSPHTRDVRDAVAKIVASSQPQQ